MRFQQDCFPGRYTSLLWLLLNNMAIYAWRNTEVSWRYHFCRGKVICTVYSDCVSVCSHSYSECKEHAPYYISVCGVNGSTMYFHITNGAISEKILFIIKTMFWFSEILSETFLLLRQIQEDSIINAHMFHTHLKYSLILSYINDTLISSTEFSTRTQISNFMKIRPVGADVFHVDGQTDTHDDANSREHLQTSQHFIMQWTHPLKLYQTVAHGAERRRLRAVFTDCTAPCRKQHSAVSPQALW